MPVILWAVDRRGIIKLSEGRGLEALGLSPGQNVGRSLRELYGDVPGAIENLDRTLAGEQFTTIMRVRGLAFEATYFPERDNRGRIVGASGIAANVTESLKIEEGLREARRHLEHVAASAPVLLWSIDRDGTFTFARGRGFAALGVSPEEVAGRSAYEAFPDFPEAPRYYERALGGETLSHYVSGRGVTLENLYFPDRNESGEIVGVSGLSIDVTERVRADEKLRLGRARLEEAQRLAQIGSWELDVVRDETRWSDEVYRIFRLAPESFAPSRNSILEFIHPEDRDYFHDAALALLERGNRSQLMCRIVTADGSEGIVYTRGEVERDLGGKAIRMFGTVQDVTERETARLALRRAKESLAEAQRIARLGSWEWEIGPNTVRWSDEVFRMFGVPLGTWDLTAGFLSRLHPEDRERVRETARQAVEGGGPYPVTLYRILHPTEGTRTCEQRAELVRNSDGSLVSMIGTVQDVTEREAAREELRRTEEGLAEAQRVAQIGSFEWETATGQARWSDEYYRVLGLLPGEVTPGAPAFFAVTHPEDRPYVEAMTARVASSGSPETMVCRIVRPDGEVRFVRGMAKSLPKGEGHRIVGTLQDITELRHAEEKMSMLSGALEQTADSVLITDERGAILYVNEAFVRQTGFSREEALGRTPRILKSGLHDLEFYQELWNHILEGRSWLGAFVNRRKDGSIYHEEKTITPVRDHLGRVAHFVSSGRDVTERRKAEETQVRLQEAVSRSAFEWRATFDAVSSPILVLDRDGRVRRPNRAARDLAGRPYTEIMGCPVSEVGPGPLWGAVAQATRQVTATDRAVSLQVVDESTGKTWDVSASPLTGPDVGGGGVIALARDVSAIMDLQESLRRSETMSAMGRLVAGVAHEVRNPLFGISATLDAFDADFSDRPEYQLYSERLRTEVGRLTGLMQDLLEYGRPTPPQLARGSLRAVIERAVRACALSARAAGVTLVAELARELPEIELDEGRLVQVYQNLIENAVQHSARGSEIEVTASLESDLFVATGVADSGPGFRDEDLQRVFEPFFTRRRGGTGLGLSIVHRIVSEHGGHIQATNRSSGGALVCIRLPRPVCSESDA